MIFPAVLLAFAAMLAWSFYATSSLRPPGPESPESPESPGYGREYVRSEMEIEVGDFPSNAGII